MAKEIERKFLVENDSWRAKVERSTEYVQGYVPTRERATVRVRVAGEHAYLTLKGPTAGVSRDEFEYEIPIEDARAMLETLCGPKVAKTRSLVEHAGHVWEVDEFHGENEGLLVAEIELESEAETFERPAWLGREVTSDGRYVNASLAEAPFSTWARTP